MKNDSKEIQKLKDKSFILNITIPTTDIQKEYAHVLSHAAHDIDIKGFRKGKAPIDVVESHLDQIKLLEQVAQNLISDIYQAKIKEYDLKPIIQPQIKILNPPISKDSDWKIEIAGCELPEVDLKDLKEKVVKINLNIKLKDEKEKKLDAIFDTITKTVKVDLPEILINADVQNKLSQLIDQTQAAGLTVAQYLKSKNTTQEKYQQELKDQVAKEWTLNLTIDQIASDNKIEVDQKEIETLVSKNPKARTNLNMLYYVMRQQKVLEYLQSLK